MATAAAETQREAFTLRGLNRAYGLDREFLSKLVRDGELPALRRGRSLVVLRQDFEAWFRRETCHRTRGANDVVERHAREVLGREREARPPERNGRRSGRPKRCKERRR